LEKTPSWLRRTGHQIGGITMKAFHLIFAANLSEQPGPPLKEAIELGNKLIEYEKELNNRFSEKNINEKVLEELLIKISETYKSLRYTHLSAHLKTPSILSEDQIKKYNKLRGYSSDDPCVNIPQGHDPVMWRKHNNCN